MPLFFSLLAVALHLVCGNRYGPFRDELYFVVCGQRLAWGYVDQPPLIAAVARVAWWLSGGGHQLWLFRLPAALSHAATVVMASALAQRFGAGTFGRALAALCIVVAPIHLAQGHLLTMNTFELLFWAAIALCTVDAVNGRPRMWLAAGALLGLALLSKYSAGLYAVALFAGVLLSPGRRQLLTRWPWLGAAVALLMVAPSLAWQWAHGWPFLELLRNGQLYKNAALPLGAVLREALVQLGPAAALISLAGLAWLVVVPRFRFLGVALGGVLAVMLAMHPKPYYLAPAFTPLIAAGAVWLEAKARRAALRGVAAALVVLTAAPAIPLVIPLLPIESMLAWQARLGLKPQHLERMRYTDVPQHFADQFGWQERVDAVVAVVHALPEAERQRAVVFAPNYGEASALELFGRPRGLPEVVSNHNQYALWGVRSEPEIVIALQGDESDYRDDFASVERAGTTPEVKYGMPYESEVPIWILRGPREPASVLLWRGHHFE